MGALTVLLRLPIISLAAQCDQAGPLLEYSLSSAHLMPGGTCLPIRIIHVRIFVMSFLKFVTRNAPEVLIVNKVV